MGEASDGRAEFRLRDFLRLGWSLVSHQTERDLKEMGRVRPELMRAVNSHLTDQEAADRMRPVVASDPAGAKATLKWIRSAMDFSPGYEADRAYRVLQAAITGGAPAAIPTAKVELYERERQLGWMPLREAFAQLEVLVPELESVRTRAEEVARSPESLGIEHNAQGWSVPSGVMPSTIGLVGRDSHHPDPLVRSSIAGQIAASYSHAVLAGTQDRALWDRDARPSVRTNGTFFEFEIDFGKRTD